MQRTDEPGSGDEPANQTGPVPDEVTEGGLARAIREAIADENMIGHLAGVLSNTPPLEYKSALRAVAADVGDRSVPLLQALAAAGNPELELAAIDAASLTRGPAAAEWLTIVSTHSTSKVARKASRTALHHLRTSGVAAVEVPEPHLRTSRHAFVASASGIDGAGVRHMAFGVEGAYGVTSLVSILTSDVKGVFRVHSGHMPAEEVLQAVVSPPASDRLLHVPMPVDYARQLVSEAAAINAESGIPTPPEYSNWKDAIAAETVLYESPIVYQEISTAEIVFRPDLLEDSPKLLELPAFSSWVYSFDQVKEHSQRLLDLQHSRVVLPDWTKRQMEDQVVRSAIEALLPSEEADRLKRRLEEMSYVLVMSDSPVNARRALAAAIALGSRGQEHITSNPFVMALVRASLVLGIEVLEGRLPQENLQPPR